MTNDKPQIYLLDTEAAALGYYAVLDNNYKVVQVCDTLEEAEEIVAENNHMNLDQVRNESLKRGRLLQEYRKNLKNRT
jgi:hypothetical protein